MNMQVSIANAIGADFIGKPNYITDSFINRVIADGGTFEAETCLANKLIDLAEISSDEAPFPFAEYLAATGITGPTQVAAIYNLMSGLKQDGLWSKMKAVYPFVTDNRNLFSYTEDFSNAYWEKGAATITSNSTTAPDGTLTADKFQEIATTDTHQIYLAYTGNISVVTISIYAKKAERSAIQITSDQTTDPTAIFNLDTGAIHSSLNCTPFIENVGNGWYRCGITYTIDQVTSYPVFRVVDSNFDVLYTGTAGYGVYIWGGQLELGSTATTYQPMLGSAQAYITNQFKYNLVNPVDSDASFRLVFNGGWNMSSQGATPNGVNGYADTKLVPNSALTLNSASFSAYSRNNFTPTSDQSLGCSSSAINLPLLAQSFTSLKVVNSYIYSFNAPDVMVSSSGQNLAAMFITTRTAANNAKSFRNTTQLAAVTTQGQTTQPTNNFFFGAFQGFNFITNYSSFQYAFAHIGDGLTDTEAANLYTRVQAFQTSLNRQV